MRSTELRRLLPPRHRGEEQRTRASRPERSGVSSFFLLETIVFVFLKIRFKDTNILSRFWGFSFSPPTNKNLYRTGALRDYKQPVGGWLSVSRRGVAAQGEWWSARKILTVRFRSTDDFIEPRWPQSGSIRFLPSLLKVLGGCSSHVCRGLPAEGKSRNMCQLRGKSDFSESSCQC